MSALFIQGCLKIASSEKGRQLFKSSSQNLLSPPYNLAVFVSGWVIK